MGIKTILLQVDRDARNGFRSTLACSLARQFDAHLIGCYLHRPPLILDYGDAYASAAIYREYETTIKKSKVELQKKFEDSARGAGLSFEWRTSMGATGASFSEQARYADLSIVTQHNPEDPAQDLTHDFAEEIIMSSGVPTLVVPYAGDFPSVGKKVMIAWRGTSESARAVHDAMPFLERAEKVTVYSVNPTKDDPIPGDDLATHLARHHIKVEAHQTVAKDLDVGEVLLSAVADNSIDLLVMGAYGHTRFRELVLGGATRNILEHMTVPTLFSH